MSTPEERLAALEEWQKQQRADTSDQWSTINHLREQAGERVTKACCADERKECRTVIEKQREGYEKTLSEKLQQISDNQTKFWNIYWRSLTALGAMIALMATWNITMLLRQSDIVGSVTKVQSAVAAIEQERTAEEQLLIPLIERLADKLDEMDNHRDGGR